jgi:hypothetical protein
MNDKFYWVEIPEKEVDPAKARMADLILNWCAESFRIQKRPRVRWFKESTALDHRALDHLENLYELAGNRDSGLPYFGSFDEPTLGFFMVKSVKDSIFLRVDLDRAKLKSTIAHELCHFLGGEERWDKSNEAEREGIADRFEERALFEIDKRF